MCRLGRLCAVVGGFAAQHCGRDEHDRRYGEECGEHRFPAPGLGAQPGQQLAEIGAFLHREIKTLATWYCQGAFGRATEGHTILARRLPGL
jgi:hypothetical protein